MGEKEKKIGSAVLIGISCFAAVILMHMWADLMIVIFTSRYAKELVNGEMLPIISYMTSVSMVFVILLFVVVTAIILGFFSRDKKLRITILGIESITVISGIVFCALATKFIYSQTVVDKISKEAFVTISTFQTSILQIVAVVAILLTATAIWYISDFRKKGIQKDKMSLTNENEEATL